MCGIVGYIKTDTSVLEDSLDKWFQQALFVDTLRGKDSTGVFVGYGNLLEQGYLPEIDKDAVTAEEFLKQASVSDHFNRYVGKNFVVGHNRAATAGAVVAENAHPFQHGNISLVHNGTLDTVWGLAGKSEVDSERICETLAVRDTKKTLEELEGAYTLVWHDATDGTVNFARNQERPLHYAFSTTGSYMLFASEPWMISALVGRSGIHLVIGDVTSLPVGTHMKIDPTVKDLRKYDTSKFTPAPSWYDYYKQGRGYNSYNYNGKKSNASAGKNENYGNVNKSVPVLDQLKLSANDEIAFTVKNKILNKSINYVKDTDPKKYNYTGIALNVDVIEAAGGRPVEIVSYCQDDLSVSKEDLFLIGTASGAYTQDGTFVIVLNNVMTKEAFCIKEGITKEYLMDYVYGDPKVIDGDEDEEADEVLGEYMELDSVFGDLDDAVRLYDGPNGAQMTSSQFDAATGGYCVNCGGNIFPGNHRDIEWVNNGQSALCPECVDLKKRNRIGFGYTKH